MSKRKNISKSIPIGRTLQTRDEFLESGKGKENIKPDHPSEFDLYRTSVIVDSNRKDELAIIKLTTSEKGKRLKKYRNGKSRFRPYIEISTSEGRAIKLDDKRFSENSFERDVSKHDVNKMKKIALKRVPKPIRENNRKKLKKLKGR